MLTLAFSLAKTFLKAELFGNDGMFKGISTNTRTLKPGELFVAIKGEHFNGHNFIHEAIYKKASGLLLSEKFKANIPILKVKNTLIAYGKMAKYYREQFNPSITAVTGSCGKTTVKTMLTCILQEAGQVLSSPGNYNNEIGIPKTLLQLTEEHKFAIIEMAAKKSGDIAYLMEIANPQVSLITNVGPCHLEMFGDLEEVAITKGEIYQNLSNTGCAVVNVDDAYAPYWLSQIGTQNIITFGLERKADVTCASIIHESDHTKFELITDIGIIKIHLATLGTHNVLNAVASAAAARAHGISLNHIANGLSKFKPLSFRGRVFNGYRGAKIIDDTYNANPNSMKAALAILARIDIKKKIFVLGDMLELGKMSDKFHFVLGQFTKNLGIQKLLGFGKFSKNAVDGFGNNAKHYLNKESLIDDLIKIIDNNTIILIKGSRAMCMEEITLALTEVKKK